MPKPANQVYLLSMHFYVAVLLVNFAWVLADRFIFWLFASLFITAAFLLFITRRYARGFAARAHPFLQ